MPLSSDVFFSNSYYSNSHLFPFCLNWYLFLPQSACIALPCYCLFCRIVKSNSINTNNNFKKLKIHVKKISFIIIGILLSQGILVSQTSQLTDTTVYTLGFSTYLSQIDKYASGVDIYSDSEVYIYFRKYQRQKFSCNRRGLSSRT